jgi:hypothetical protein
VRRSDHDAGFGQAGVLVAFLSRGGDPEVRNQRVTRAQKDVVRLDVTMDHALDTRVLQRLGHVTRDTERFLQRELASRASRARSDSPAMYGMVYQSRYLPPPAAARRRCRERAG